ncbi:MAG: gamma carbonic anhydrase family protein [Legionellales bacterium]|nr:gamma carbonic anhydrase family protein [Legionellales bacterium]OUX66428.1 MAG: gamma carbonic anhydrase family protein [Gammaproteobacteria bacterium TMED281]
MIRTFKTFKPEIDKKAYIDETALIIGQCIIGADTSIWPMCVLRGDVHEIIIGKGTNIQDGCIIHCASSTLTPPSGRGTYVGDNVTVGHGVILHACTSEDNVLIGMGSTIMDDAHIEENVIIGANSLVSQGQVLRSGHLYFGSPCKERRALTQEEIAYIALSATHYVDLAKEHYA